MNAAAAADKAPAARLCHRIAPEAAPIELSNCPTYMWTHPQRRQAANVCPRPAICPPHLQVSLQPDLGEDGGEVRLPVLQIRVIPCRKAEFQSQLEASIRCDALNIRRPSATTVGRCASRPLCLPCKQRHRNAVEMLLLSLPQPTCNQARFQPYRSRVCPARPAHTD